MSSKSGYREFDHPIQLQLFDGYGIPVENTQICVILKIIKNGSDVTIQLPAINFQTGPTSSEDPYAPAPPLGTLRTIAGFLPENLRPSDPVYRSYLGASNNGMSQAFSFTTPPADLPVPIVGYIVSVTLFGELVIQGAGTNSNAIFAGPQILLPMNIEYIVEPTKALCSNFEISTGASNITQFTIAKSSNDGYRDSHVNDAFDNIFVWAWSDNSNIPDKTNNILNIWVRIGKMKDGKLKLKKAIQLTTLPAGLMVWDTAVAINRIDKNNIVVSYGILNNNLSPTASFTFRAVSFDGGKTWPINGQTNIQPTGSPPGSGFGDNRGVASDKFGNIWYCTTNRNDDAGDNINQPTFWISSDKGLTFSVAYTTPNPFDIGLFLYDFPQFCFGGDGLGNYGLWFTSDTEDFNFDLVPVVGFIPIIGLGVYGAGVTQILNSFANSQELPSITASADGRVWVQATAFSFFPNFSPVSSDAYTVRFKSPGPIDANYAGPWQTAIITPNTAPGTVLFTSYPGSGYFNTVQSNIYDEQRQALYSMINQQVPSSQNMVIYIIISRNNGQTWTKPFYISNSNKNNRGFPSMVLDVKTGNLVFGWYDGRNDPSAKSVEYEGAVLLADQLTEMVNKIPLTNPLYSIPGPQLSVVASGGKHVKLRNDKLPRFPRRKTKNSGKP